MSANASAAMIEPGAVRPLEHFGALRFRGPEAHKFLQGQLSNDMQRLRAGAIVRAGLHNAQGRALALLWLAASAEDDILGLLPLELVAPVAAHLRRYLLRAKLTISDASAGIRLYGLEARTATDGQEALEAHRALEGRGTPAVRPAAGQGSFEGRWSFDERRALLICSCDAAPPGPGGAAWLTRAQWRQIDIATGMPQIYAATSGQFVAQMLNLDCIDAISFTKGCYTGQEVIARAHYRGRVKRRMQRFESLAPARLAPGDTGQLEDSRSFRVVDAYERPDGSSEFLAVAAMSATMRDSSAEAEREPADAVPSTRAAALRVRNLPLPYALPE